MRHEPLVNELQELELANALFSSPFASSPWRLANVVLTAASIVASVAVTVGTALSAPAIARDPADRGFDRCRVLLQGRGELVEGILRLLPGQRCRACPAPSGRTPSVSVADFASPAAVCSPLFVGSLFTEPAAVLIAACQVVIDEQTPLAQVSVAEALVVVVALPPLEPQPAARNASEAATASRLGVAN